MESNLNVNIGMPANNADDFTEAKKPELCLTVANSEELKAEVKAELEEIAKSIQPVNHTHYHVEKLDISDEAIIILAKESTKKSLIDKGFSVLLSSVIMGGVVLVFKNICKMPTKA